MQTQLSKYHSITSKKWLRKPISLKPMQNFSLSSSQILPTIIHHRNMLKHCRSIKDTFQDSLILYLRVDFSRNLSIPIRYEPQSWHWHHDQVSIQSGILKVDGEKSYHLYFSDSLRHDQVLVKQSMNEMINEIDLKDVSKVIIKKNRHS